MPEITLWSQRFNKSIQLTRHARARMLERNLTEVMFVFELLVVCKEKVVGVVEVVFIFSRP